MHIEDDHKCAVAALFALAIRLVEVFFLSYGVLRSVGIARMLRDGMEMLQIVLKGSAVSRKVDSQ